MAIIFMAYITASNIRSPRRSQIITANDQVRLTVKKLIRKVDCLYIEANVPSAAPQLPGDISTKCRKNAAPQC